MSSDSWLATYEKYCEMMLTSRRITEEAATQLRESEQFVERSKATRLTLEEEERKVLVDQWRLRLQQKSADEAASVVKWYKDALVAAHAEESRVMHEQVDEFFNTVVGELKEKKAIESFERLTPLRLRVTSDKVSVDLSYYPTKGVYGLSAAKETYTQSDAASIVKAILTY